MKFTVDLADSMRNMFKIHGYELKIISAFITGSYANSSMDALSDLDIVIIGSDENRYKIIVKIKELFEILFAKAQINNVLFYCDPSQELLCFLNPVNISKLKVHLIYHPFDRFNQYLNNNDQVLLGWKTNYLLLHGSDYLDTTKLNASKIDVDDSLLSIVDNLIQILQNSFFLTEIEDNYFYFLKLYKIIIKRLMEYEKICTSKNGTSIIDFKKEKSILKELTAKHDILSLQNKIIKFEEMLFSVRDTLKKTSNN